MNLLNRGPGFRDCTENHPKNHFDIDFKYVQPPKYVSAATICNVLHGPCLIVILS